MPATNLLQYQSVVAPPPPKAVDLGGVATVDLMVRWNNPRANIVENQDDGGFSPAGAVVSTFPDGWQSSVPEIRRPKVKAVSQQVTPDQSGMFPRFFAEGWPSVFPALFAPKFPVPQQQVTGFWQYQVATQFVGNAWLAAEPFLRKPFNPAHQQFEWFYEATASMVATATPGWTDAFGPLQWKGMPAANQRVESYAPPMGNVPTLFVANGWQAGEPRIKLPFKLTLQWGAWAYEASAANVVTYPDGWQGVFPSAGRKRTVAGAETGGQPASATFMAWTWDITPVRRKAPVAGLDGRPPYPIAIATPGWSVEFNPVMVRRNRQVEGFGFPARGSVAQAWHATYFDMPVRRAGRMVSEIATVRVEVRAPWVQNSFDAPIFRRRIAASEVTAVQIKAAAAVYSPMAWPDISTVIRHPIRIADFDKFWRRSGFPIYWRPTLIGVDANATLQGVDANASLDGIKAVPGLDGVDAGADLDGQDDTPDLDGSVGDT